MGRYCHPSCGWHPHRTVAQQAPPAIVAQQTPPVVTQQALADAAQQTPLAGMGYDRVAIADGKTTSSALASSTMNVSHL
jgi:hypothetical protein